MSPKFKAGDEVVVITLFNPEGKEEAWESYKEGAELIILELDNSDSPYIYGASAGEFERDVWECQIELKEIVDSPLWKALR